MQQELFFNTRYWIIVNNIGYYSQGFDIKMKKSKLLNFHESSITPVLENDSILIWHIDSIGLFEDIKIAVDFEVAGVDFLGDSIINIVQVIDNKGDIDTTNNTVQLNQIITGSYDPNDKTEHTGIKEKGYTLFDSKLSYTIRFQNTGTDTAFNIKIIDTLDSKLDIQSFRISSYSHPCTYDIDENGIVTIAFNNILLPDSIVNEPESHGYVKYTVLPQSGFKENTEVSNTAYIYFDYNPAIVTNTMVNTFVNELPKDSLPQSMNIKDSSICHLYPIPAREYVVVSTNNDEYKIYNLLGQIIKTGIIKNSQILVHDLQSGIYYIEINDELYKLIVE